MPAQCKPSIFLRRGRHHRRREPTTRVVGLAYIDTLGPDETESAPPISSASRRSAWGPRPTRSKVLTSRCSPTPTSCLT